MNLLQNHCFCALAFLFCGWLCAQGSNEIQVYGPDLVKPGDTSKALHEPMPPEAPITTYRVFSRLKASILQSTGCFCRIGGNLKSLSLDAKQHAAKHNVVQRRYRIPVEQAE